jgi:hypothetical protein
MLNLIAFIHGKRATLPPKHHLLRSAIYYPL